MGNLLAVKLNYSHGTGATASLRSRGLTLFMGLWQVAFSSGVTVTSDCFRRLRSRCIKTLSINPKEMSPD